MTSPPDHNSVAASTDDDPFGSTFFDDLDDPFAEPDTTGTASRASDGRNITVVASPSELRKQVFDPHEARDILDEPGGDAGDPKERARQEWLIRMRDDPQKGYRPQVQPGTATLAGLESLAASASHVRRVLDLILAAARAANLTGRPMQCPPILLLGAAGVGKTYVAREIAQRLGIPFEILSMPNLSGSGTFNGLDTSWRSPKIGAVAKALIASGSANPLFLLDEIDKTPGQHSEFGDPLGPLYDLLEPTSASTYREDFLKTRFAADTIFWLATANSTASLSAALLDRFIVIEVDRPSEMQMSAIIESLYADVARAWDGWFSPRLPSEVNHSLRRHHPRRARRLLGIALTLAAGNGRKSVWVEDIDMAAKIAVAGSQKPKFGFL